MVAAPAVAAAKANDEAAAARRVRAADGRRSPGGDVIEMSAFRAKKTKDGGWMAGAIEEEEQRRALKQMRPKSDVSQKNAKKTPACVCLTAGLPGYYAK